jgi:lysophospholipase L1-like esterase
MRRRLLVLGLALLGSLVAIEVVVRVRQWMKYGTSGATFYQLTRDPASGLLIPTPGHEVGAIRVNSLGFRSPELEIPKPEGRLRIAFLGGSTTFCAEASTQAMAWPNLVVAGLRARSPELEIDFVNAGAAGYSTRESLLNLEHRVAPLQPDVIVIYHGTNDLTQDSRALAAEEGLYDPDDTEASWLSRYWLTWYLIEKNLRYRTRQSDREGEELLHLDPRELAPPFRERLTTLITQAQAVAPIVCVVTFSIRGRADQSPAELRAGMASSLYYMPFLSIDDLLAGFAEINRVIREVAATTGALLVEGEESIPGDGVHFNDSVHLLDPGLELQAKRVLEALGVPGSD